MSKYKLHFQVIFEKALLVNKSDHILIIYDETIEDVFNDIVDYIIEKNLLVTFIYLPLTYQQSIISRLCTKNYQDLILPSGLLAAIPESSVIINLLSGNIETTLLRKAIINQIRPKDCRLAHIPGLSTEILELTYNSPFEEILSSSENIAWILGEAHNILINTKTIQGKDCNLKMYLNGWYNEPLMSPGVLYPGSWGNIPPGETFCCPDPQNVYGDIVVNGSIPGMVFNENEEVVLTFESGVLTKIDSASNRVKDFFNKQENLARINNDKNWKTFAELGIGLNPVLKKLTGNSLFDEKMLGTIHIAIGDNSAFGHHIRSNIHLDLCILKSNVWIDDELIINEGKIDFALIKKNRQNRKFIPFNLSKTQKLYLNFSKYEIIENMIKRRLARAGRVGFVNITEIESQKKAIEFIKLFKEGEHLNFNQLQKNQEEYMSILSILEHYKILEVE